MSKRYTINEDKDKFDRRRTRRKIKPEQDSKKFNWQQFDTEDFDDEEDLANSR